MGIARRIVSLLADAAREVPVADVRIGLGYTAVRLADGRTGVAGTFRDGAPGGCSRFHGRHPLAGRPAADLLGLLASTETIETGVGLACANALANRPSAAQVAGDVLRHVEIRPTDDVAMIGHFAPLVGPIQARARSLTVIERVAEPTGLLRPEAEGPAALARCQVALVTATSIIGHQVDRLLEAARNCRHVVLLGASTPLLAEAFTGTSATLLSGVVVADAEAVLRVVSEGGGTWEFKPYVRKVAVAVRPPGAARPSPDGSAGPAR